MSVAHDEARLDAIVSCAKRWRSAQIGLVEAMTKAGFFNDEGGPLFVSEASTPEAVTKAHADYSIAIFDLANAVDSYPDADLR
jgi:hypothetical protein